MTVQMLPDLTKVEVRGEVQPQKQQPRSQESTMSLQSPTPTRQHEYYGICH